MLPPCVSRRAIDFPTALPTPTGSFGSSPPDVHLPAPLPLLPHTTYSSIHGRAIAQEVSGRLPIVAAQVRYKIRSCGIGDGQSSIAADIFRVPRFPLPIFIPPTASHTSLCIIRCWYNRPNSGQRTKWTQSHPTPPKN
jgi:hypothetical protein